MYNTQLKFNVCRNCGGQLMVIKSMRYETCRIRIYCCKKCKDVRKSVENFKEENCRVYKRDIPRPIKTN